MKHLRRLVPAFIVLTFASAGTSLAVGPPVRLETANPAGAPVHLVKAGDLESGAFRLKFRLTNASREFVPWVEMTADVYRHNGDFKGFLSFTLPTKLRAGEERFFYYRSDSFDLSPGDKVVLSASLVRLGTGDWTPRSVK